MTLHFTRRTARSMAVGAALLMMVGLGAGPARAAVADAPGALATRALAAALASPAATTPSAADTPGDQPLPGYTISNPTLAPIVVGGQS
ncbi:hypothetical protein ACLQ2X_26565, partial [Micromonospora sp. DT31]